MQPGCMLKAALATTTRLRALPRVQARAGPVGETYEPVEKLEGLTSRLRWVD